MTRAQLQAEIARLSQQVADLQAEIARLLIRDEHAPNPIDWPPAPAQDE